MGKKWIRKDTSTVKSTLESFACRLFNILADKTVSLTCTTLSIFIQEFNACYAPCLYIYGFIHLELWLFPTLIKSSNPSISVYVFSPLWNLLWFLNLNADSISFRAKLCSISFFQFILCYWISITKCRSYFLLRSILKE